MEFKGEDIFKPFKNKSRAVSNAMIDVLGDKYKSQIEKKLGNTKIICAGSYVEDMSLHLPMKQMQYASEASMCAEDFKNKFGKQITDSDLSESQKQDELYIKYTKAKYESEQIQNLLNQDKLAKQEHAQTINKVLKVTNAAKDKYIQMASLGDKQVSLDEVSKIDVEYLVNYVKMGKQEFLEHLETDKITKIDVNDFCNELGIDKETFINNLFTEDFVDAIKESGDVDVSKKYYKHHIVQQVIDELISEDFYIGKKLEQDIISAIARGVVDKFGFATVAKKKDGENIDLCFFPTSLSCQTNVVSHELLHIADEFIKRKRHLELAKSGFAVQIINKKEKTHSFVNFTDSGETIKTNSVNGGEDNYTAFNEIFNEYITRKVVKRLSENGVKIGHGNFAVGDSGYDEGVDMFSELFDEFFEEFVKCKMKPNLYKSVKKHIGFENFNKLSKLAQRVLDKEKVSEQEKQLIFNDARNVMSQLNKKSEVSLNN